MKRDLAVFVIWAAVYIGAVAANLGSFWWGDGASAAQLGVTALYAAVCLLCLWLTRSSRRWMRHGLFWSLVGVAGGIFCLLARQGIAWSVIPALILGGALFTSLYGLTHLVFLEDWDVFYALMPVLSAVWTAVCALLLWRLKRRSDETHS